MPHYYSLDILSYSDYYPFGMLMPNRNGGENYRYNFQGQETDDEVKGKGNSVNYKYRMHDPRLGRFFAVDPLTPKYPHYTPYSFSANKVINALELEGLEEYETYNEYAVAKGDNAIPESEWIGQDGAWLYSDRIESQQLYDPDMNNRFFKAASVNLEAGNSSNYQTMIERAGVYRWFYMKSTKLGYETRWAAGAFNVVLPVNVAASDLAKLSGFSTSNISYMLEAGNEAIFNDVYLKLKYLLKGEVLKGDAALEWDKATLSGEQHLVQPLYEALSSADLTLIGGNVKQDNIGAKLGSTVSAFKGELLNVNDRWKYGLKEMGYNVHSVGVMPAPGEDYTNGV